MEEFIADSYYKPILQFNHNYLQVFQKICEPLNDLFKISSFCYARFFDNGYYISLSNCQDFQNYYIVRDYFGKTSFFKNQLQYFSQYKSYKIIWPDNTNDDLINGTKSINIVNGFNVIRRYQNSMETCFFGAKDQQNDLEKLYYKYPEILERFRDYFINQTYDLINLSIQNCGGTSPYLQKTVPLIGAIFDSKTLWEEKIADFIRTLQSSDEQITGSKKNIFLTPRELECLSYLSSNKTMKEIAQVLHIKPRTVEKHIDNIRNKTACHTRSDLVHWFEDNFNWL